MRRKTAVAGIFYLAGMFFASFLSVELLAVFAVTLALLLPAAKLIGKPRRPYVLLAAVSLLAGMILYGVYYQSVCRRTLSYNGETADFSGRITEYSYVSNDVMRITAKGHLNGSDKATVTVFTDDRDCDYNDIISFNSKFSKIHNDLAFAAENYNSARGIYLETSSVKNVDIQKGKPSLVGAIRRYSDYLCEKIYETLPQREAAFIVAMLCGDRSGIDDSLQTELYRMGIGHLFSVSGTHIVIVGFVAGFLLSLLKISKKRRLLISEIVVAAFVIFSGLSPSSVRAAIMMTVINLSFAAKRIPDNLTSLAVSGIIIATASPYLIRSPSFLLSMSGAFSFGTAAPAVSRAIAYNGKAKGVVDSIIYSCVAWVCSLPFCLMFFNEVSVFFALTNLLALPLCSLALMLSVTTVFVGGISVVSAPLLKFAALLLKPVLFAAELLGKLWFSYIPLGYSVTKAVMLLSVGAVVVVGIIRRDVLSMVYATLASAVVSVVLCFGYFFSIRDQLEIFAVRFENSFAVVLNKNRKAVIIEMDGGASEVCMDILEKRGATELQGVFAVENTENIRADYYRNLTGCSFDYNDCRQLSEIDGVQSSVADIEIIGAGVILKNEDKTALVKLEDTAVDGEFDLIIDAAGDQLQVYSAYEEIDINSGDGAVRAVMSPNKKPIVRRF